MMHGETKIKWTLIYLMKALLLNYKSHNLPKHTSFCILCGGPTLKFLLMYKWDPRCAQLVEALRYKPRGCGFDPWWCH